MNDPYADSKPVERKFACTWQGCGKAFLRKTDVTRHFRIHLNDRPFKCVWPGCGKAFMQRSAVKIHYRYVQSENRTHTGEKPNLCPFEGCNKAFNDTSSLARHRRTHHYDTPFPCSFRPCPERFATRKLLLEHEKMYHNSANDKKGDSMDLPTPQITPDSTPRQSPNQPSNLALAFQSYVPPMMDYQRHYNTKEDYNDEDHRSFVPQVIDYRQDMKSPIMGYPLRDSIHRYGMGHPPPMLQIHNNMGSISMMSPTYSNGNDHLMNGSTSPDILNSASVSSMAYSMHQLNQISSPDELHGHSAMQPPDLGYNRSFVDEYKRRQPPPPRINTQVSMYGQQSLTSQYTPYGFKSADDRRFSAPILSPVYSKHDSMGFHMGNYEEDQPHSSRQ